MKTDRQDNPTLAGKGPKRTPHSIRFLDPEWDRIEAFAGDRGLTSAEFVRFAVLAAIEEGDNPSAGRLAPLIETAFRASYILALKVRDEMLEAGKEEALMALIAEAHERQEELLSGGSD